LLALHIELQGLVLITAFSQPIFYWISHARQLLQRWNEPEKEALEFTIQDINEAYG
jgi:hypothetical protein